MFVPFIPWQTAIYGKSSFGLHEKSSLAALNTIILSVTGWKTEFVQAVMEGKFSK